MDNLAYSYNGTSNQLSNVSDGTGTAYTGLGFKNLTGSTGVYTYDDNGNLKADPKKGITLDYNILNRTDKITITTGSGGYLTYTYDVTGILLRKQQYNSSNTLQKTTDYSDGFVYENGTLAYFGMPEGRVRNASGTLKSEYMITDQQGNVRVSFEDNGSGTAIVKQENSYYPFGLVMNGSTVPNPSAPNKNLYNAGAEWQNDFDNLPDYYNTFYRNYDAALGRFIGVDPKAEVYDFLTSYQYAGNSPGMYNDPFGDLFSSWADVQRAIDNIQSHGKYGGHASSADDYSTYASEDDAFMAGANYINMYGWNSGGSNFFSSYSEAAGFYNGMNGRSVATDQPSNYISTVKWYRDGNGGNTTVNGYSGIGTVENFGGVATSTAIQEGLFY